MSDLKTLENKINHVDKVVTGIDTTMRHLAERLSETVKHNSIALAGHDSRINELERSFHAYDGSVKALNRLLSLGGVFAISGVIWLFSQAQQYKQEYALLRNDYTKLSDEVKRLTNEVEKLKYDQSTKPADPH